MKALIIIALIVAVFGGAAFFGYTLFIQPQEIKKEEAQLPSPTPPPDPMLGPLEKALALKQQGKLVEARDAFEAILANYHDSKNIDKAKDALGDVNTAIYFSALPSPE